MKPILFNTEMVQAILDGRKTVTRRVVKPKYSNTHFMFRTDKYGTEFVEMQNQVEGETFGKNPDGTTWHKLVGYIIPKAPYKVGDILYVRETFNDTETNTILYAADKDFIDYGCKQVDDYLFEESEIKWRPSIHMPKEAARIFLKLTDVRVERLQDIDDEGAKKEGSNVGVGVAEKMKESALYRFKNIWNSTIKKKDFDKYGWNANPWVWVIEFERTEKLEESKDE